MPDPFISITDQFIIVCPYCGESVEVYLEPDVEGNLVQDCEVCCNPWDINVDGRFFANHIRHSACLSSAFQ